MTLLHNYTHGKGYRSTKTLMEIHAIKVRIQNGNATAKDLHWYQRVKDRTCPNPGSCPCDPLTEA